MTVSIPSEACHQRSAPSSDRLAMHVLLWSQSQCAMHIEPVSSMLTHNRRAYVEDRRMDYVPIAFGTRDLCSALAVKVRQTLNKRRG